jgi:gluconate 2-dehydrogenase gamma chain
MDSEDFSRRLVLRALAAAIGAAAVPPGWLEALQTAGQTAGAGTGKLSFFSASEAADVEAIAAQIVPTDETPGAREVGALHFIDQALAIHLSQLATDYRANLAEFQSAFRGRHPGVASFSALGSDQQIAYLKTVDRTPFFEMTRLLTLLGMFSMPRYGGNRDELGWKLIGFEVKHVFQPPFGYYDRDYPGFAVAEPTK